MLPLRDNVPTRRFPVVTVRLIAANVLVWIWEFTGTTVNHDVEHYGYYVCSLSGPCVDGAALHHLPWYEGAFTSMFMHGSWIHIGGNMLFLWIFGNNVEDAMGKVRFLAFYLLSGLAATALQTVVTLAAAPDSAGAIPNLGASGAISGVLGAYLLLLPTASVLTLIFYFFIEVPAFLFLGVWFLFQLWDGGFALLHPEAGGGVAFFAHVGGFVFGVATVRLFVKRPPLRPLY